MAVATGKIAEVLDAFIETHDKQDSMVDLITQRTPEGAGMQDSGNWKWKQVQQNRPDITGWDVSGEEGGIIQETVPLTLGTPHNDVMKARADDMRNDSYWSEAGKEAAMKQCTVCNSAIADKIIDYGGLFYRDNSASAFDFMGIGQRMMNERELKTTERCFILNDTANLSFSTDLAGRQTLGGRPETIWTSGQITQNVAGFDNVMVASYLKNLDGGTTATTINAGTLSFAPSAGSVSSTGVVTNVDYRAATITLSSVTGVTVGDKLTIADVYSVGLSSKNSSGNLMTFTVAGISGSIVTIYPKPIAPASSDASLTKVEGSYNNIDAKIVTGAAVTFINTGTSEKSNIFFDKSAISVMGGTIPAEKYASFAGKNVIHDSLKNGLEVYMLYDGDILETSFTCRLFVWYGINIENPSNCGVAIKY